MNRLRWQLILGLSLIVLSAFIYFVHYLVFGDPHHIIIYLVGDIAFVPVEVLMVTLVIHRLLSAREKRSMLQKMNMVIGVFFSEVGTELLGLLNDFDSDSDLSKEKLTVTGDWSERKFSEISGSLRVHEYRIEAENSDLAELRSFLMSKRDFLLRLLENPNLLEHDSFTDLLWAVFHLSEELGYRDDLSQLPDTDSAHLAGDIKRAYVSLISQWLGYMKHLKYDYPYLFSLAVRTNPLDKDTSLNA